MVRIGSKGMSYIVKNCPCFRQDNICIENSLVKKQCQEYNCCVIKKIIEECSKYAAIGGICETSENIMDLFDIEEYRK